MAMGSKLLIVGLATVSLGVMTLASVLDAGGLLGGRRRSVGGVSVDPSGLVRSATVEETTELRNLLRGALDAPRGEMAESTEMRMISLKGLQQAIVESRQTGGPLPDEIALLAGLQRVEYVFIDEANSDVILAGPAEPWKLADDGSIVGAISGRAMLHLDDLVVAMRSVESARREGISCSIEPTAEGRRRLKKLLSGVQLRPGQDPSMLEPAMREAFGPQQVALTGVPDNSRYALAMLAADYQMKRIAMALTESSVAGLPSYLEMARNIRQRGGQNPRWWMACDYDALSRTEDGMAWKVSGQGVKTLTEQDLVSADGSVAGSGRTDPTAARWADRMTEHYGELAKQMPVFQDLRNLMDLTVVATLIQQERLADKAGLDLSLLLESNDTIELASYPTPESVAPECSFIRGRAGVVATASGGVDINAFEVVENQTPDEAVGTVREEALAANTQHWWWDR